MNIDITKKYQTRDGREVRIYAGDGHGMFPIHAAVKDACGWHCGSWRNDGRTSLAPAENPSDLIPAKTWRAWKEGEAPKFFMVKAPSHDGIKLLGLESSKITDWKNVFDNFLHLHEDGTATPCGVEE